MKYALLAAAVALSLGSAGCGALDTFLYGGPSCSPRWTGNCGGCAENFCGPDCGDDCGECGSGGGYCHECPLLDVLGALHPDRLLCVSEYRERDDCGNCGHGCGKRYWGDWYGGERAGCESCDCHGGWAGPTRGYAHRGGRIMHGDGFEGEIIEGEPTPVRPAPPPRRSGNGGMNGSGPREPNIQPGPQDGDMPIGGTQTRSRSRFTKASPAKVTKSRKPVTHLRPVDGEGEWTPRRYSY